MLPCRPRARGPDLSSRLRSRAQPNDWNLYSKDCASPEERRPRFRNELHWDATPQRAGGNVALGTRCGRICSAFGGRSGRACPAHGGSWWNHFNTRPRWTESFSRFGDSGRRGEKRSTPPTRATSRWAEKNHDTFDGAVLGHSVTGTLEKRERTELNENRVTPQNVHLATTATELSYRMGRKPQHVSCRELHF
jgi:hypothetical protein